MLNLTAAWNASNDRAEGFPLGSETQTPSQAALAEGFTVVTSQRAGTSDEIVLARRGQELVIVANAHGPWAVPVTEIELGA